MKLRKDQRFTAYVILLEELENYCFFCWGMICLGLEDKEITIEKLFPELYRYRPKKYFNTCQWFSGSRYGERQRRNILKKCIEETANF